MERNVDGGGNPVSTKHETIVTFCLITTRRIEDEELQALKERIENDLKPGTTDVEDNILLSVGISFVRREISDIEEKLRKLIDETKTPCEYYNALVLTRDIFQVEIVTEY